MAKNIIITKCIDILDTPNTTPYVFRLGFLFYIDTERITIMIGSFLSTIFYSLSTDTKGKWWGNSKKMNGKLKKQTIFFISWWKRLHSFFKRYIYVHSFAVFWVDHERCVWRLSGFFLMLFISYYLYRTISGKPS